MKEQPFDLGMFVRAAGDALHKNGQSLSIAFTVALLGPAAGPTITAIVREETKRWNEERELRRRLADLEQQSGL